MITDLIYLIEHEPVVYALPVFTICIFLEIFYDLRKKTQVYNRIEALSTFATGLIAGIFILGGKLLWLGIFIHVNQHWALFHIPIVWYAWIPLIILDDFTYYWFHRLGHEVNILWAGHVTHHSSQRYHLVTALRQAWLEFLYKEIYWLPLAFIGFPPLMIFMTLSFSQIWGFFSHTQFVKQLGFLELIFSTPAHHRVHHGSNPQYINKNYGNMFIFWDKWFGTFAPETEPIRYGITKNINTLNPLSIGLGHYANLARQLIKQNSLYNRFRMLLANPASKLE